MQTPRIFVDAKLVAGESLELDERAARHLLRVLRSRPGDSLLLFNGDGREWHATFGTVTKRKAIARVSQPVRDEPESQLRAHLLLGISRSERMDFAIQKAVELGVDRITPLLTRRVIVKLEPARLAKRVHHWQGIMISACEQSGRSRVPELVGPTELNAVLQRHLDTGILLDPSAKQVLCELDSPGRDVALLVGPEGGLTEAERAAAIAAGYHPIRLGPRILRTETAPLAALAALQTLWGDFR